MVPGSGPMEEAVVVASVVVVVVASVVVASVVVASVVVVARGAAGWRHIEPGLRGSPASRGRR